MASSTRCTFRARDGPSPDHKVQDPLAADAASDSDYSQPSKEDVAAVAALDVEEYEEARLTPELDMDRMTMAKNKKDQKQERSTKSEPTTIKDLRKKEKVRDCKESSATDKDEDEDEDAEQKSKQTPPPEPNASKKPGQVTDDERVEIEDAWERMNLEQFNDMSNIIVTNDREFAEKYSYQDPDGQIIVDGIGLLDLLRNDVQAMLLAYVRSIFDKPNVEVRADLPDDAVALDDNDFEPTERGED